MINKKNVLGKAPFDLGQKDAIHVAIVAVRSAGPISPGQRCALNEFNEAVPRNDGPGVADPFLKGIIQTGQAFWFMLDQTEVPNVTHVWDHPTISFDKPTREVEKNRYLVRLADEYGVTYEQLMDACASVIATDEPVPYPGTKTEAEIEEEDPDKYELWSEWSEESGYEFDNLGTECCPEYEHPSELFSF